MTRINIISVSELYDQHLIAEYREITMVPAALKRTLNSKKGLDQSKIPINYTLNKIIKIEIYSTVTIFAKIRG